MLIRSDIGYSEKVKAIRVSLQSENNACNICCSEQIRIELSQIQLKNFDTIKTTRVKPFSTYLRPMHHLISWFHSFTLDS